MAKWKWYGGFMGLLSGDPLGLLAGFVLGAVLDSFAEKEKVPETFTNSRTQEGERNGFLFSLMVLSAHIIHADAKIMHSEMEYVRKFLRHNFSIIAEKEGEEILLRLFEQKKRMGETLWENQIRAVCQQIASVMPYEQRLQLVAFLTEIAKADKKISQDERNALRLISQLLGLPENTAEQMMGLGGTSLDDAYRVLGISKDSTDEEVRAAYKKMARENHPDKVAALGEDVRRAAEKKFQEIGNAKDRIYKARNMK